MANLEIQIGADSSELSAEIAAAEAKIKRLGDLKADRVKLGLDTKELNSQIAQAKAGLKDLQSSIKSTGQTFDKASNSTKGAGNTLTQFSRIAQDAPFGIMGIGNNLTATAEAFASLTKESGGAGNALKAVGASLAGPGGILLAVSLVTTALTVMSQKGITIGDIFSKLTGTFDEFKKEMSDLNAEAAKNSAAQVQEVKSYAAAAKNLSLSMQDRLTAVKKLQDEYPAFFGNLSKEAILNGNVSGAIEKVTDALKAKARAQAIAGKLGELAAKEFTLTEKAEELNNKINAAIAKRDSLLKQIENNKGDERLADRWQRAGSAVISLNDDLSDLQIELAAVETKMNKLAAKSEIEVAASVKLDFKPDKIKKVAALRKPQDVIGIKPFGLESLFTVNPGAFEGLWQKSSKGLMSGFDDMVLRIQSQAKPMSDALIEFWTGIKQIQDSAISNVFGGFGNAIGQALASGGNVLNSIGASLVGSFGDILSAIGDKLIALGAASIATSTLLTLFGTPAGIPLGWGAIALGTALKIGGSFASGSAKNITGSGGNGGSNISAGNSVSSPSSSFSGGSSFNSGGTVVFEISGQSLVGVLSNTLNKNVKLGGAMPAI